MLIIILIAGHCQAQSYEYAEVLSVRMGIYDKGKIIFQFNNDDSTAVYNKMKPRHVVNVIEMLESKGWEVVTITNSSSANQFTYVYFRRRKK